MNRAAYNQQIIAKCGCYLPETGLAYDPNHVFYVDERFVNRHGTVTTARLLTEMPWDLQYKIKERATFIESYSEARKKLESKCIRVITPNMGKVNNRKFLDIAKKEGWVLQLREGNRMTNGRMIHWLFSTRNRTNDLIYRMDRDIHKLWRNLPKTKFLARTQLLFSQSIFLKCPDAEHFTVGILDWDEKQREQFEDAGGWMLGRDDVFKHNELEQLFYKMTFGCKEIIAVQTGARMYRTVNEFGHVYITINGKRMIATKENVAKCHFIISEEGDKFGYYATCRTPKFAINPAHTPADVFSYRVVHRHSQRMLQKQNPTPDLSAHLGIIKANKMTKDQTIDYLAYKTKKGLEINMGNWLAYLGFPLSMCDDNAFWNSFGAQVRDEFFEYDRTAVSGTVADIRLAPQWLRKQNQDYTWNRMPPAKETGDDSDAGFGPKVWHKQGMIFQIGRIIKRFFGDGDGDLMQAGKKAQTYSQDTELETADAGSRTR